MSQSEVEQAALTAADRCLKAKGYISIVDVLMETGRLSRKDYERWRCRQVPFLERVIQGSLPRINRILRAVRSNSLKGNLKPSWTAYMSWGKGRPQRLRFSKSGDANLERAYATHYLFARKPSEPQEPVGSGSQKLAFS